jgi:signal transduction histidine kinase
VGSLFVIQGPDQGRRFELRALPVCLGRDALSTVRLSDNEVSRKHAEIRSEDGALSIIDLDSANGTFLNGESVHLAPLRQGDRLQLGRTVLIYRETPNKGPDLTDRVNLLGYASTRDHSAIIRTISSEEGSRILTAPERAGEWLKARLAHLSVMYQATQAVSDVSDLDELLPQILHLVFETVGADRGVILMAGQGGELAPKAVRWRSEHDPSEKLTISRTIVDHVRSRGEGVLTTDASRDSRFGASRSIVDYAIREALCVPLQGRHATLGVLYADAVGNFAALDLNDLSQPTRFTQEHLTLMVAIGHEAGLAIENTQFHEAKLQAERLAAVGQTIATLSHHIKNILQGLRSGSFLIEQGLRQERNEMVRSGWGIVEKNQTKIYNLVMDMLSFCKEREPALEAASLNQTVADVIELMKARALELGVELVGKLDPAVPEFLFDAEGIHRAVLNIISNALDACEDLTGARVEVGTEWDNDAATARIIVRDTGPGIAPEQLPSIFEFFASTKGTRGTGLGLPVSRKILREHGGDILVDSELGQGSTFTLTLPGRSVESGGGVHDPLATQT